MSGLGRLTVCAAAATLLTACSLLPLTSPLGWFVEAVLIVLVQAGVGAAARRVPLARPLVVLAQAVTTLLLLTFGCVRGEAVLGFLPGPRALDGLGQLLAQGLQDVSRYAIPAPVTPGIRLLLLGGVALVALLVDLLAVTYRSAAPAGLPLLALYSVASGLATGGARWLWFLCAACGYLLLLLSEGRDRLSRWGRVFSGAPRSAFGPGSVPRTGSDQAGQPVAALRSGRRIGVMVLGVALFAPVVLPAMGGGLLGAANDSGLGGGGAISAVNPLVSLQNSLNQQDDREVLSYRTNAVDTADMYLRIVTLDQFDGTSWKASERKVTNVPSTLPTPAGLSPGVQYTQVTTEFSAARGYAQNYLPMPYPASRIQVKGDWRYEPEGRTLVGDRGQTTSGLQYQVQSLQVEPTAKQLADAPPPPPAIEQEYTKVPSSLPPVVKRDALSVTRGSANAYQEAVKLQDWFTTTGDFTYDTQVAEGTGPDAIARFLKDRRGFCVHFAFTMAAMARTLGIPARVDVGFVPGTPQTDNGYYSVGLKDAHAWPELYFQGIGWTRFEPTPSRGNEPDYTRQTTTSGGGDDLPAPHLGDTTQPSTGPTATPSCTGIARRMGECSPGSQVALGGPTGGGPGAGTMAIVAGAVLLIAFAALPMIWRARVRAIRLGGGRRGRFAVSRPGDPVPDDDGTAAGGRTLAAWRELLDTGWDYGVPPDSSETPRRACDRLIRSANLADDPARAVRRVGDAVEQVLYAPRPQPAPGVPDDVRLVHRALHRRADRLTRLRARVAPRSVARVLWRLQDRWSTARSTWRRTTERITSAVLTAVRPGS